MPNRLINETSPYLLQHAHNPVDWYPWGDEALQKARSEDKPIFLSIGYAACHWCHVMERESFEDEAIAQLMNENFVAIKVDREERPDVDAIYMDAVQALSGHGGWPLSVFLTPEGHPFFGGTYFPPEDRSGMPGFPRVLRAALDAYRSQRDQVIEAGANVIEHIRQAMLAHRSPSEGLTASLLSSAYERIVSTADKTNGGFGTAPKFPQPMLLEFLLRYYARGGQVESLSIVETALRKMAAGGIYDHLGGGFHRYSTDSRWLVPHFEKMLYDNALLALVYLHTYQVSGVDEHRRVAQETLDFLLREMRTPEGGFYSTLDADSDGKEGQFYVWSRDEIDAILPPQQAALFIDAYGVTEEGNFEGGRTVLNRVHSTSDLAETHGLPEEQVEELLSAARGALFAVRERRTRPGRDEKILTAWNGLTLKAFAEVAAVLDREDYKRAATALAGFLVEKTRRSDGRLLRSFKDGRVRILGYLEDYSFLADALLTLFETTSDRRWLDEADRLATAMVDLFWSDEDGVFFDVGHDAEKLAVRPRTPVDNATPSGGAVAAGVLLRLATLTGSDGHARVALEALRGMKDLFDRFPGAVGYWLSVLEYHLAAPKEIALIGPLQDARMKALVGTVVRRYMPNKVLVAVAPENVDAWSDLPILEGRGMINGVPTAFVCEHFVCKLPVTNPIELEEQLTGNKQEMRHGPFIQL